MKQTKLFNRDFLMVVIGQIISLFGNAILRYALPIYLLNETHSPALFGIVSACAFIPMVLLAPIGGIVADRVNKRNVMVILDFSTAVIIALYSVISGHVALVPILIAVLMLLYGIQGAYQPAVQASIPSLQNVENLNSANAVINMVSSLSGLLGPVLGGIVYVAFGLKAILFISIICFVCSAVMEIFIKIPFTKRHEDKGVMAIVKSDMGESIKFIRKDCPVSGKIGFLLAAINLIFSALMMVGLPVIVTERLGFTQELGNTLYGYAEGGLALGGIVGGVLAGVLGKKLNLKKSYLMILFCTLTLVPITLAVALPIKAMAAYIIIVVSCVAMIAFSTIYSIQIISYAQRIVPEKLIGKVMALISCLCMCATPLGQAIYGTLFEKLGSIIYVVFIIAFALCLAITVWAKRIMTGIEE